jgi:hypothetical protein
MDESFEGYVQGNGTDDGYKEPEFVFFKSGDHNIDVYYAIIGRWGLQAKTGELGSTMEFYDQDGNCGVWFDVDGFGGPIGVRKDIWDKDIKRRIEGRDYA